ncbi:hypothetical protein BDW22DRAFT_1416325 [Trametopsis cervina]|nr:hypothetical protein BDW22DRAFT_1416325 [Trametopsis cervina]
MHPSWAWRRITLIIGRRRLSLFRRTLPVRSDDAEAGETAPAERALRIGPQRERRRTTRKARSAVSVWRTRPLTVWALISLLPRPHSGNGRLAAIPGAFSARCETATLDEYHTSHFAYTNCYTAGQDRACGLLFPLVSHVCIVPAGWMSYLWLTRWRKASESHTNRKMHSPYSIMQHHRSLVPLTTLQYTLYYRSAYPYPMLPDSDLPPPVAGDQPESASATGAAATTTQQEQPAASSSSTPSTPTATSAKPASRPSSEPSHPCLWADCDKVMSDPEVLYNHLCNDHIGRKSTGNLCLTCKWKDCGTTCAKRDHITSHLRVHTPLKPHVCEVCNKPFKRPQDLKKHEKIHTEEHHAQHKHSKAITVSDPVFSSRVRGDGKPDNLPVSSSSASAPHTRGSPTPLLSGAHQRIEVPVARAKSGSVSLSESSSDFGPLPTPSPEMHHSPIQYTTADAHDAYRIQPAWEVLRPDGSSGSMPTSASAGAKRSYDTYAVVDEFFTDVKKRRVNPSYDPSMAERLSALQSLSSTTTLHHPSLHHSHQQHQQQQHHQPAPPPPQPHQGHNFNPRSVSFDIRSPEELAAVNEFLITLGRDISAGPRQPHDFTPSYFDAASLSQLGLAGMPGVPQPGSGAGYHGDGGAYAQSAMLGHLPQGYSNRAQHPSSVPSMQYGGVSSSGAGMYPNLTDMGPPMYAQQQQQQRRTHDPYGALPLAGPGRASFFQPTPSHLLSPPPLEGMGNAGGASPYSTHSTRSTPPLLSTPPHLSESLASFDALLPSRVPPTAQLAPVDYQSHTRRAMVPLMTVPPPRAEPVQPKWNSNPVRGPPARLTSSVSGSAGPSTSSGGSSSLRSSSSSLYPLLTSGDAELTLPPLQRRYRSPSASPAPMSVDGDDEGSQSGTPTPSPPPHSPASPQHSTRTLSGERTLPPLRALEPDRLARQVGRIALDGEGERRRAHAEFLRDMLVTINREFRSRYGTPPPTVPSAPTSPKQRAGGERRLMGPGVRGERDVEMVAV